MKNVKFKTIKVDKKVIQEILCNKCGKSCNRNNKGTTDAPVFEAVEIDCRWGYYSNKDLMRTKAYICESCWDKFEEEFKFKATFTDDFAFVN